MAAGGVSRADLLVALETLAKGEVHARRMAAALGFEWQAATTESIVPGGTRRKRGKSTGEPAPVHQQPDTAPPRAPRHLHVAVTKATRIDPAPATDQTRSRPRPLPDDAGRPERTEPLPPPPLLVRPARLGPALRSSLRRPLDIGLDLRALLRGLACGRTLKCLPRRRVARLGDSVWAVMDVGDAMAPYRAELSWLIGCLRRFYGTANVRVLVVRDSPDCLLAIDDERQPWGSAMPKPPPGQRVLLGSHLGLLSRFPRERQRWLEWLTAARVDHEAHVTAWLPCTAAWIDRDLADAASLHCMVQQGSLRRQRGRSSNATLNPSSAEVQRDELLRQAALCLVLEPALLRALRLSAPTLRHEPALEGLCWTAQPFVGQSRITRALTPEGIRRFRDSWSTLARADQRRIWDVMLEHQRLRGAFLAAAETMVVGAHTARDVLGDEFGHRLAASRRAYDDLWRHARARGAEPGLAGFAADMLARQGADTRWLGADKDAAARLQALSGRADIADGIDTQAVARAVAELSTGPALHHILEWRHDGLWLCASSDEPLPCNSGRFQLWQAAPSRSLVVHPAAGLRQLVALSDGVKQLATRDQLPVTLDFEGESLTVADVPRPAWAHEWGRDERGLYALSPPLGPWQSRLYAADGVWTGHAHQTAEVSLRPHVVACGVGADEPFGVYIDLILGSAGQRLRWIAPGEFWMGSTDEERARINQKFRGYYDDESPRHRVALTQGFWLADAACTQALWRALMSSNPSEHKGETLPVENVSHKDVEQFLERLQALLPAGLQACLPTEAEWEYACRAGSETAFAFGDTITHAQANVADLGEFAPPGRQAKRGKRQTVPVQSLPPNAWGLYEMHGNVWEWCADGMRKYGAGHAPVVDPGREAGQLAAHRAVRGGSWFSDARCARSAYRDAGGRSARNHYLGFRLALRSTSTGPSQVTSPESARDEPTSRGPEARANQFSSEDGSR